MCPQECLFIISRTTSLSFVLKRIGPLAAISIASLYLLAFYLFAISNTPANQFASICSETFIETARQHLMLLVGFDTLIYRKYCDTPPILVGHQSARLGGHPAQSGFHLQEQRRSECFQHQCTELPNPIQRRTFALYL